MKLGLSLNRWFLVYAGLLMVLAACVAFRSSPAQAATGVNQTINFQGRLLNGQGALVPDGFYNIEFKIYQDGDGQSAGDATGTPAGTLKWTEDYLNANSKGVKVVNGFLSVQLGSINPFGSNIDWNQDTLWLSMNIAGTGASCTPFSACSPDGEMLPMQPMTSSPFSLNSMQLGGLNSDQFIQLAQGVQTDNTTTSSIFINKTGASGNILQLQNNDVDVFAVDLSGATTIAEADAASGNAADVLTVTGGDGASTATAGDGANISLSAGNGGSGATANGNGGNITLSAGSAGSGAGTAGADGSVVVKNQSNSEGAFQVQNSTNSKAVLAVDTTNNQIVLGSPDAGGLTGQIKLFYAGSSGSTTLVMADPGANNYQLTIPAGGGIICTTANSACSGGGTGGGGLAKNAIDTSSADAGAGYLYAFTNSGNSGTGGVLSLNNGNNTGAVAYLKGSSTKAFQVQNSAGYNALVLDTASNPAHLKVYDGTATQAYADIYYDDATSSAIFTASTGTTRLGANGAVAINPGANQAVTITGHATSSWTLDSGDLTLDVTSLNANLKIGTGTIAKTVTIGNSTATTVNINSGSGGINLTPSGASNTGVVVKPTANSTLAFQVQNSTSSKAVLSVNTTANQVLVGNSGSGGITGQLAFNYTGVNGKVVITPEGSPGGSTFTLKLPTENGTICTSAGSAACLTVYGGGEGGNFLARDATDTSTADSGGGYLYSFTNSGSNGSGGVLRLDNGNNTGSTISATTSGNPGTDKAVIYGSNTNASPSGNLLYLAAGATPTSVFSVDVTGKATAAGTTIDGSSLIFGDDANASVVQAAASQALNITANASSLWQVGGTDQNLTIQTSGTGTLALDTTGAGTVSLGSGNAAAVNIGNSSSTTTIAAGSGNINLDATMALFTESAAGRVLSVQDRSTNDAGTDLTIQAGAGGSGATAVTGGVLALVGGNAAGTGNANGGNLTLTGGAGVGSGVEGSVVLSTATFSATVDDPNCFTGGAAVDSSCTIADSSVNGSSTIVVGFSVEGQTATLPDPVITTAGRIVYITAASGSKDFTLSVNGGGTGNEIAMRQNTSATMIWSGTVWTAAGASSSTTLQAAYDNTLQSAGGAELVVSHTSATNGLTIRDSSSNPVNGTLLSVQTASAATLLSINGNVTEYSSDGGAETAGSTSDSFPAGSWSAAGAASVSRFTTVGNFIATGQASVSVGTTTAANDGVVNTLTDNLTANTHYNVSFAVRLTSGTFTDMNVYYSKDGVDATVPCITSQAVTASIWTKVNCAFGAPASGITANNAIFIRQTGAGVARTFYVDNLSVTIAADFNYASDGGVDDDANFSTNWTAAGAATVTRSTSAGNDASDSAQADTTGANQGVRNKLSINPLPSTLYRVTVYATSDTAGFDSFTVRYSRDGGTSFVDCADYNTQSISSIVNDFTEITCYISTDSSLATNAYVYFIQGDGTARTFYVDTFSLTLSTNNTPNVQIGGGINGGPVALLTLDRAAAAPIASNNDALLGSMYYDTTLGKLQCYEKDGWGACGSSPDNIVTISPEYTNAVMHGTGVGTMTSDICSSTLNINDGTSGQPTICGDNETFNFYKWTSPQASAQTYSIYVTYQLPGTFKSFASGQTSIMGRTDSSNAIVKYGIYRDSSASGLLQCGPSITVSSGAVSTWQTGVATGATDPSTCGFSPGESVVFKIDVTASHSADAYVGNLNFTFSNK